MNQAGSWDLNVDLISTSLVEVFSCLWGRMSRFLLLTAAQSER